MFAMISMFPVIGMFWRKIRKEEQNFGLAPRLEKSSMLSKQGGVNGCEWRLGGVRGGRETKFHVVLVCVCGVDLRPGVLNGGVYGRESRCAWIEV